jgi:hypothetical protein
MGSRWEVADADWDRIRDRLRAVLEQTARSGDLVSYGELVQDVPEIDGPHSHALAEMLGEISAQCHAEGRPLLSAVVTYKERDSPGPGFFAAAKRLGKDPGRSAEARDAFWIREVRRCWTTWAS